MTKHLSILRRGFIAALPILITLMGLVLFVTPLVLYVDYGWSSWILTPYIFFVLGLIYAIGVLADD